MITRVWTKILGITAAVIVAGCGGGGGSSAGAPAVPPPAGSNLAGKMVISIPNAASGQSIGKKDVPPAANSISIVVVTGSVSAAPQIADISPTSPNCTSSAAGRTCTIAVSASAGSDTFNVTIYDGAGATGHQLAVGSAQTTVVPGAPFSVSITLNGIVSTLAFYIPQDPNQDYPGPQAGIPGSVTGTVVAKDASGNYIVGPYATPVSLSSSSSTIALYPTTLTQSGPVTYTYNGGANSTTLTATSGSVTASLTVNPQSNILTYQTPTVNPYRMLLGPDGKIYVNELGLEGVLNPTSGLFGGLAPGKIARFDPVSNSFTGEAPNGQQPIGLTFAPDGSIWTSSIDDNLQEGAIGHITGFATYTAYTPPTTPLAHVRDITLGPDGKIWFTEQRAGQFNPTAKIGTFAPSNPASMTEFSLPAGSRNQGGMTVGPDGNFWVSDAGNLAVDRVTTAGVVTPFAIPGSNPANFTNFPRYLATGSDGNVYMTDLGNQVAPGSGAAIWKINPSTGVMTATTLPNTASPDDIVTGPPGKLYFNDNAELGLGVLDLASGTATIYPFAQTCAATGGVAPSAVVAGPDGSLYFTLNACDVPQPAHGYLGHLILAPGWRLFPLDKTLNLSTTGSGATQLLGIAESGNSAFSVTSSNPAVVTVATLSPHNYMLSAVSNGTATLTVSGPNNTSVTRTVVVSTATATISSTTRRNP